MIDWLELYLKCLSYAQSPRVVSVSGYQAERSKTESVSCPVTAVTRWPPTLARVLSTYSDNDYFSNFIEGPQFLYKDVSNNDNDSKHKMSKQSLVCGFELWNIVSDTWNQDAPVSRLQLCSENHYLATPFVYISK